MQFKYRADRTGITHLGLPGLEAALKERVDFSYANDPEELPADDLQQIIEETTRLKDRIEELKAGGLRQHPGFPGARRSSASSSLSSVPGFKAGHWSDPLIKRLEREEGVGGTKALLSGSITVPSLTGGIVPLAPGDRATSLVQVIDSTPLNGTDTFRYLQETVRTHNAAEVAAGGVKPTSIYTVQKVDDTVRTIAHVTQPINRFDLEDTDLLRGYIDGSLRAGVLLRLDSQILFGNGTAPNLRGLANTSGIQTQAFATNLLTTARKALTKLQVGAERYSGVYVVSPGIWETIELAQEADGTFVNDGTAPVDLMRQRLWGQPVVVTNAITGANPNCYLFAPDSVHLWERDAVTIDWSEAPVGSQAGNSAFLTNELIFRGEGRFGFGVPRPAGVVQWATI